MSEERPRAIVVGVQLQGVSDHEHTSSLDELTRLADTMGLEVIGRVSQKRKYLSKGLVVGRGKLKEIAGWTGGSGEPPAGPPKSRSKKKDDEEEEEEEDEEEEDEEGTAAAPAGPKATVVLFDHDLGPSQAKNLEGATSATVLDRSSVILEIFQRHAKSREARLQVEIARLNYLVPRLRESGDKTGRQRGGGTGGRGAGESSLELDRRKVRDRISELRRELEAIQSTSNVRRNRRSELPLVALVGYTNAGKSSLMRRLTGSEVYVADKLFATLDTTVRSLVPETKPRILVSDTVGFIKKLPHDLVASFRSTLDEARDADLLLHLVDASDPAFDAQIAVTEEVLTEIGAATTPRWLVMNKIDRVDPEGKEAIAARFPNAVCISALRPEDVAALHRKIVEFFERDMVDVEVLIPYNDQSRAAAIHESCRVLSERFDEDGRRMVVRIAPTMRAKLTPDSA